MPRNVRNFWITASVDGATSKIVGGPKAADGGFSLTIKQRDHGTVTHGLTVDGWIAEDGTLILRATDSNGKTLRVETQR